MNNMERECELDLVARVRAGDAGAFDAIHAEFNTRLFNFLARLARRREVAEDLLEETWLRFVDRAPQLREDTRLGPFLFTIARNLHVSYCRSRAIEDAHAPALLGLWPTGAPQPSPFDSAAASQAEARIEAAMASMPAMYREALLLVACEGLRPAEAALICGITPEAMRQRLSRGREMLTTRIDEMNDARIVRLKEVTT